MTWTKEAWRSGSKQKNAKLTEDMVKLARRIRKHDKSAALDYLNKFVHRHHAEKILTNKNWTHI